MALATVTPYLSQWPRVGVGERGARGRLARASAAGARERPERRGHRLAPRSSDRDRPGRPAAPRCSGSSTPPTSTSARATPTSGSRRPPSASASSPPSGRRSTWRSPRRSTCSSSPATCSTPTSSRAARWSASPPSSSGSPRRRIRTVIIPGTHDVYDRSSIYRAYDLPAHGRRDARTTTWSPSSTPDRPSVHLAAPRRRRPRPRLRHQAGPAQPARRRPRCRAAATARRTWQIGDGPRLDRDPGQDRPRRGRHHGRGDRASGLDYLALGHWHSAQQRARPAASRTPTPARPSRSRSTRTGRQGPARRRSTNAGGPADGRRVEERGRQDALREARGRRRDRRRPAGARRAASARADPDLVLDVRLIGVRPRRAGPRHRRGRGGARRRRSSRSASASVACRR